MAPKLSGISQSILKSNLSKDLDTVRHISNVKSASIYSTNLVRNFTETIKDDVMRHSRMNQQHNHANDLLSMRSVTASQKIKNNRVFVYKIIHDLKHPTNALVDGLSNLIDDLSLKNDSSINFDKKRMKYMSSSSILKALSKLKDFAKPH